MLEELLVWILCILVVGAVAVLWLMLIVEVVRKVYRCFAYDYAIVSTTAVVIGKTMRVRSSLVGLAESEYYVSLIAGGRLECYINDVGVDMYSRIKKDTKLQVKMKIGRSRKDEREIKDWKILDYSLAKR